MKSFLVSNLITLSLMKFYMSVRYKMNVILNKLRNECDPRL